MKGYYWAGKAGRNALFTTTWTAVQQHSVYSAAAMKADPHGSYPPDADKTISRTA